MLVCVYFRMDTQSSHVGMYIFSYVRTDFIFAFTYLRTYTSGFHVCVCVYMYMYAAFCIYLRICTQSLGGCVCGYVYAHRVCMCLCSYICTGTQNLHVLVCISAYTYTEFTWMCVHGIKIRACTHVRGTG